MRTFRIVPVRDFLTSPDLNALLQTEEGVSLAQEILVGVSTMLKKTQQNSLPFLQPELTLHFPPAEGLWPQRRNEVFPPPTTAPRCTHIRPSPRQTYRPLLADA